MESTTVKVNIKWGKKLFEDVEINMAEDIIMFKAQIYGLSNVPVDKQKVMAKGKILKDENQWKDYPAVKDGATLMLMGTAEGNELKAPQQEMKFVEDMTPEEIAKELQEKTGIVISAGLENLGNTCYMNSVMQCLKRVNELKEGLMNFELDEKHSGLKNDPNVILTQSAKGFMGDLEKKGESFAPYQFVAAMRQVFPMFNETDEKGHHKQQDAEECYTQFLSAFQQALKLSKNKDASGDAVMDDGIAGTQKDPVTDLFGLELESTVKNAESDAEPEQVIHENVLKLPCHIDNNNNPIDQVQDGLKISLEGEMEKFSEILQKNAVFKKTSKVNKLPSYLCIQFVRFYWKKESNVGGTKAGKAKILRSVAYPRVLDLYHFCSAGLKSQLDEGRKIEEENRIAEDAARLEGKKAQSLENDKQTSGKAESETQEERKARQLVGKAAKLARQEEEDKKHDEILYRPHGSGLNTGNYELVAVVTHKGRSADGGHYVGWVHKSGDTWLCFDDDIVTTVKSDEILALRGGGDWHTAYLTIYRKLETTEKPKAQTEEKAEAKTE